MLNLGKVIPGSTIYIPFDTFAAATGAPITITNFAVGDIKIFKNGGTTERASTTGFTLLDTDGVDFDGITGIQGFSIDLSSTATGDFYQAGADYFVVVSTITVDGQTVSFVAARFTIGYEDAVINTTIATLSSQTSFTLSAGPAEDDALNGCRVIIHDAGSAVQIGFGLVLDYTGSTKTVTLVGGVTFTAAAGDNISILPPIVSSEIAAIKAKTDNLPSDPADASDIASAFGTVNATLATIAAYVDTEVGAIKTKTDNLPSDPADASVVAGLIAAIPAAVAALSLGSTYPAVGVTPTLGEALLAIFSRKSNFRIVGADLKVWHVDDDPDMDPPVMVFDIGTAPHTENFRSA